MVTRHRISPALVVTCVVCNSALAEYEVGSTVVVIHDAGARISRGLAWYDKDELVTHAGQGG